MIEKIKLQKCINLANEIDKIFPLDKKIKKAFSEVPREYFVPTGFNHYAYKLDALPLSSNQWISSPLTVAKMTTYLKIDKNVDSILEIGCGSGYQASILSKLTRRIFTIERIEKLALKAKKTFKDLNLSNIHVRYDDGQNGWPTFAPFDRILYSATAKEISNKIFNQLKVGGILIAPIEKNGKHIITKFLKTKNNIEKIEIEDSYFVPILNGIEK